MVFASNGDREYASSAFIFASTSSDLCLSSSEHFRHYRWRAAGTSKFSRRNVDLSLLGFAPNNLGTPSNQSQQFTAEMCLKCGHQVDAQRDPKLSNLTS